MVVAAAAVVGYAYVGYPAVLVVARVLRRREPGTRPASWPEITITVPAYNEEHSIGAALDRILAADYPPDRRHVLVVSDASTDGTEEIVRSYAARGVRLVRLQVRGGKTAAENEARHHLRGTLVVNTDASVRLHPQSLQALVAAFEDPTVGVASGRDVSVARAGDANVGESGYVGYEMWVRDLETAVGGIVGASGCFYASRIPLHMEIVPAALSRDFAAPLVAREHGYRAVSVRDAVCFVPRASSLRREYHRKVRTMTRGLQTLYYKRHLMNPARYGRFAWMLISHKLVRWLVPWAAVVGMLGAILLALRVPGLAWAALATAGGVGAVAAVAWAYPERRLPRPLAVIGYVVWGLVAGLHAWIGALRGDLTPTWEPTRRPGH